MATVIHDRELAEQLIAQRRAWGGDHHDEVWEGVYMMSPLANNEHQEIVSRLNTILDLVIGLEGHGTVVAGANVSDRDDDWTKNYRCPDVVVRLQGGRAEDRDTYWLGGPDFLVEVVSPDDQSREKLPFYADVGTREVLIIDRDPWRLELFRLRGDDLVEVGRSEVETGTVLSSEVVPLTFRRVAGEKRPQIEVVRSDADSQWLV